MTSVGAVRQQRLPGVAHLLLFGRHVAGGEVSRLDERVAGGEHTVDGRLVTAHLHVEFLAQRQYLFYKDNIHTQIALKTLNIAA